MPSIKRYFPNWMEMNDDDYVKVEFNSLAELMEIDWVKKWSQIPNFLKYSIAGRPRTMYYNLLPQFKLMVELKDGKWWVLGILSDDIKELPQICYENKAGENSGPSGS
jgi:hypothetical protein